MTESNLPPRSEPEQLASERSAELEAIFGATTDGLILLDAQGRIRRMNPAAQRVLGNSADDHQPDLRSRIRRLHLRWGDGRPVENEADLPVLRALQGETIRNMLVGFEHPETHHLSWASVSAAPIRSSEGAITGVVTTFSDVTAMREAQQQREFYDALLESAPAGICVLSGRDLRAKYANTAYHQFLDEPFRSEGIVSRALEEFVPGAREQGLLDLFHRIAETGEAYVEAEYRHEGFARGTTYWRYSVLPFHFGSAPPSDANEAERDLMVVAIEVTEQVRNRQALEQLLHRAEIQTAELHAQAQELSSITQALDIERARLSTLIDNLPVGVILAEAPSGRLVLSNRQAEEIWRHSFVASSELGAYGAYRGFRPDGRPYAPEEWPLARSLSAGEVIHGEEIDFQRGDDTWGVMSVSSAPIYDREGRIIAAVVSFSDISERIEGERALRHTRDELASLLTVSQTLVSTLDLPQVLALLVRELRAVIPSDGATIYLLDGDQLVLQEYVGPAPRAEALATRLTLARTAVLWDSVRNRTPIYVPDLEGDTPLARVWQMNDSEVQRRLAGKARSYLAVPIMVKEEPIGILRLIHYEPDRFTDEHARLATAIANQAAIAIENARLYGQAQEIAVLEERQRLARDLHDSVSQALFAVVMATHGALTNWETRPQVARARVEAANQLAKTAQAEMRALIFELRPDQLETDGLVKALELQTTALKQRGHPKLDVALCEEPELPLPVKEAFYRIAQEAINNALKHAKPTHMAVSLRRERGGVGLQIVDNGKGFDPDGNYPGHLGLRSMRERAQRVGAALTIESAPQAGTRILLEYSNTM